MLKLGRKPARHTVRTMRSALVMARALDPLGAPPTVSNDYTAAVTVPWKMLGNDSLGDCVCADSAHSLMLRTANTGNIIIPTDNDVISLYEAVGGYVPGDSSTDNGCDETSMCEYLEKTGFLGHKLDATASIDPHNLDHIRWCIQLFGSCRIGIDLTQSAMDAFNNGQVWDANDDENSLGGHDIPLVKYDKNLFYCVTWGQLQPVTSAFIVKYNEEAHAELHFDWTQNQGVSPSGFNLDDLYSKIKALN